MVNDSDEPLHTGVLLLGLGDAGAEFTATITVPAALVQPPTLVVKL